MPGCSFSPEHLAPDNDRQAVRERSVMKLSRWSRTRFNKEQVVLLGLSYWDSSALIKLYAPEPDSPYFLSLIAQAQRPPFSSEIARAEVLCTLYRKEYAGDLKPGAAATLFARFVSDAAAGHLVLIPNGADVTAEA